MDALWGVPFSSLVIETRRTVELHDFVRTAINPLPSRGGLSLGTVKVQPGSAHDVPENCDRGFAVIKDVKFWVAATVLPDKKLSQIIRNVSVRKK